MLSPPASKKAAVKQGTLVTWRVSQLRADLLSSLQQVTEQTRAEAEATAVKSIHVQRGLKENISGLMWDGSG